MPYIKPDTNKNQDFSGVVIDGGKVSDVRSEYCEIAVSEADTGTPFSTCCSTGGSSSITNCSTVLNCINVDGVTIIGDGTPSSPFQSVISGGGGGGSISAVSRIVTSGNPIATHNNGVATNVTILESDTPIVDNGDGTYTYTSESGTPTVIDTRCSLTVNAGTTSSASDDSLGTSTINCGDTLHLYSPDGTVNFSVAEGSALVAGTINISSNNTINGTGTSGSPLSVAISSDDNNAVTTGSDGAIFVPDAMSANPVEVVPGIQSSVPAVTPANLEKFIRVDTAPTNDCGSVGIYFDDGTAVYKVGEYLKNRPVNKDVLINVDHTTTVVALNSAIGAPAAGTIWKDIVIAVDTSSANVDLDALLDLAQLTNWDCCSGGTITLKITGSNFATFTDLNAAEPINICENDNKDGLGTHQATVALKCYAGQLYII